MHLMSGGSDELEQVFGGDKYRGRVIIRMNPDNLMGKKLFIQIKLNGLLLVI